MLSDILENCPEAMPAFQAIGMHCMGCALASGEKHRAGLRGSRCRSDEFVEGLKNYLATLLSCDSFES